MALWGTRRCALRDTRVSSDDGRPKPVDERKFVTMDAAPAVEALRRVAFLLERRLAETYKVKAFRNAAATVLRTPADELFARADAGTLKQLPGIGKATESVITDALA